MTMNTNRNKSTAHKLHVGRKTQKKPQEEFGAEVKQEPSKRKHQVHDNQPQSERTAWH